MAELNSFDWRVSQATPQLSVALPSCTTESRGRMNNSQSNLFNSHFSSVTNRSTVENLGITNATSHEQQVNTKLPESTPRSSSTEDDQIGERILYERDVSRNSPPPNCAICLGRCKNKCFTDSCLHQFCFKCLCEWSKVS